MAYFHCRTSDSDSKPCHYTSGMVNSNMVNSKFHLIRSYCEIFFYNFPNIPCLKCTVNSNFHLIRSKTLPTNDCIMQNFFTLVQILIQIPTRMVSRMVTVPILGMDLCSKDRSLSLLHRSTFQSGNQNLNPNQWKNPA